MSPLSPGLLFRPSRVGQSPPAEGVLLPTTLDDFDDSVLGDPITYARCENFPPSGSTFLLDPTVFQTVLASGTSSLPAAGTSAAAPPIDLGDGQLLESGLPGCLYRFSESGGLPFSDGNPAYDLQIHHPRFVEFVGAPESARLLDCSPTFWVDQLGKEQAMVAAINLQRDAGVTLSNLQILSQFVTALHRMSFSMMALGIGQSLFPGAEVDDLSPAPRAARAASYMSAMCLWRPQTGPDDTGPVPVSLCRSCMNCKYCFSGGLATSGVIILISIILLQDQPASRMMTFIGEWLPVQNIPRRWMRRRSIKLFCFMFFQPEGQVLVMNSSCCVGHSTLVDKTL